MVNSEALEFRNLPFVANRPDGDPPHLAEPMLLKMVTWSASSFDGLSYPYTLVPACPKSINTSAFSGKGSVIPFVEVLPLLLWTSPLDKPPLLLRCMYVEFPFGKPVSKGLRCQTLEPLDGMIHIFSSKIRGFSWASHTKYRTEPLSSLTKQLVEFFFEFFCDCHNPAPFKFAKTCSTPRITNSRLMYDLVEGISDYSRGACAFEGGDWRPFDFAINDSPNGTFCFCHLLSKLKILLTHLQFHRQHNHPVHLVFVPYFVLGSPTLFFLNLASNSFEL